MTVRVRLAPSPTGTLHIGTARTALFNWLYAKKENGKFLIRIEDTDKERSKNEYTKNILQGLKWLGISWDEEPIIQSQRVKEHSEAIKTLIKKGLAYRCFATEKELELMRENQKSNGEPPRYDNRCRNLSPEEEQSFIEEGRTSVIRFRIDDDQSIFWDDLIRGGVKWSGKDLGGDIVISRRAPNYEIGAPLYNLVVVVDDAAMNISHVIRGEDHIANTAKQILLYRALELNIPKFAHTPLILNQEGKKLSKRDGVTSINDFKEMGYTAEAMANYMTLLGWSVPEGFGERFTLNSIVSIFSLNKINKAGAKFDWDKLNWINSQVIHNWSPEYLSNILRPYWLKAGWEPPNQEWAISLAKLIGPSMTLIKDGISQAKPFFEEPELQIDAKKQLEMEGAKKGLETLLKELKIVEGINLNENKAKEIIDIAAKNSGLKKGLIMKSLRAALLGQLQGPDLISTWLLLSRTGHDRIRIKRCI